jgi:hypothetical protein
MAGLHLEMMRFIPTLVVNARQARSGAFTKNSSLPPMRDSMSI